MLGAIMPSVFTLSVILSSVIMLSFIVLSVIMLSVIMLSVIMHSVIMHSVIMLSFVMLSVSILSVYMLSVATPLANCSHFNKICFLGNWFDLPAGNGVFSTYHNYIEASLHAMTFWHISFVSCLALDKKLSDINNYNEKKFYNIDTKSKPAWHEKCFFATQIFAIIGAIV